MLNEETKEGKKIDSRKMDPKLCFPVEYISVHSLIYIYIKIVSMISRSSKTRMLITGVRVGV
jgi:hypothetical protein